MQQCNITGCVCGPEGTLPGLGVGLIEPVYILAGGMPFISCRACDGGVMGIAAGMGLRACGIMPAMQHMTCYRSAVCLGACRNYMWTSCSCMTAVAELAGLELMSGLALFQQ